MKYIRASTGGWQGVGEIGVGVHREYEIRRWGYKCMRGKGVGIHRRGYGVSNMGGGVGVPKKSTIF